MTDHPQAGPLYFTGRWYVITDEAAARLFHGPEGEATVRQRRAYIPPEVETMLGLRDAGQRGQL